MLPSVETLLANIVDYAGLFPPAKLDMGAAVRAYASILAGPHAWMAGRFIVPVSRLDEFEREAARLFPAPDRHGGGHAESDAAGRAGETWRISALVGEDLDADIDRVFAFNQKYAPPETDPDAASDDDDVDGMADAEGHEADDDGSDEDNTPAPRSQQPPAPAPGTARAPRAAEEPDTRVGGGAVIDALEIKAATGREVDKAMTIVPEQLGAYFEIPINTDPRGIIAAMAGTDARAKVRTGGVTPEAFPAPEHLARFIAACAAADVGFKATAGLHHPLRGDFRLTYEPNAPTGVMYGFLNVFLAAAFLRAGGFTERDAAELLQERDPKAFTFEVPGITWRGRKLGTPRIALARENFASSFGSCSFDEPVADLKALGLLTA